jgi:hypothetical protein
MMGRRGGIMSLSGYNRAFYFLATQRDKEGDGIPSFFLNIQI